MLLGGICGFWLCSAASVWLLVLCRCSYAFLWRKWLRTAVLRAWWLCQGVLSVLMLNFVVRNNGVKWFYTTRIRRGNWLNC